MPRQCDYLFKDESVPEVGTIYYSCGEAAIYQLPRTPAQYTQYSCKLHVGVFINHILGRHASAIEVRLIVEEPNEGRRN